MNRLNDIERDTCLGRGLLGTVYRVDVESRDRPIVLKVLDRAPPDDREAFRQYVEALARLDHPHLVHYLEPLDETTSLACLEAWVDGTDLASYLRRPPTDEERTVLQGEAETSLSESSTIDPPEDDSEEAPEESKDEDGSEESNDTSDESVGVGEGLDEPSTLAPDDRLDLVLLRLETLVPQIVSALKYLHRFRTPHGNLKPTNVLVDEAGHCRLSDFGLVEHLEPFARPSEEADPEFETARRHAQSYRAPELGPEDAPTPEGDLYALGCLLFEAIAGCRPVDLQTRSCPHPDEAIEASMLSELEPRCPAPWVDLVLRLLEPDPEARPPLEEVRSIVEGSRPRSVEIPPTFVPEQDAFFGRPALLEQLIDDVQTHARSQSLGISLLSGEAGVGKTALTKHVAHWASKRGWLVLRGRCYRRESGIYQGWNEIGAQLREICERIEGELGEQLEPVRRRAARLLPMLVDEASEFRIGGEQRTRRRHEAVANLRSLLRLLASQRPLLILMDDLDWASRDTASLLADLIMEPDQLPCVVLGTWRSREGVGGREEGGQLLEALRDAPVSVQWRSVRAFNADEAERYAETNGPHLSEADREQLVWRSRGNPLLLEELIYQKHLLETEEEEDPFALPEVAEDEERRTRPGIEAQLSALIRRRLDGLSRREHFVVELLSVASLPLSSNIVSLILDEEFHTTDPMGHSMRDVLAGLRRLRLVQNVRTHRWDEAYALFHEIGRRLILDEMPDQRYTHLCGHIADALQRLRPEADGLRFEYLLRADRSPEAADRAVRHAHYAESCYAFHRASKLWHWIAERPELTRRLTSIDPRRELARVERLAGRPGEAARLYDGLAEDLPEGFQQTRLRADAFDAHLADGNRLGAIEALKQALLHYGDRYDAASLVTRISKWKHRTIAATNRWSDDLERTSTDPIGDERSLQIELYRRLVLNNDVLDSTRGSRFRAKLSAIAERSKHALLLGYDRFFLGRACHPHRLQRRVERAHEWYDEAAYLFERADAPLPRAQTSLARADLYRKWGNFEASRRALETAAEWTERANEPSDIDFAILFERARLFFEESALDRAEHEAHRLLQFFRGHELASFYARRILVPIALLRGAIDRAELLLDRCSDFLEGRPPALAELWLARQTTRLDLALGRPEVAVGRLEVVEERFERAGLMDDAYARGTLHLSLAQASIAKVARKRRLGESRQHDVFEQIESSISILKSVVDDVDPPMRAETYRLFARFEMIRGDGEAAETFVDEAIQQLASYPSSIPRTLCAEAKGMIYRRCLPEAEGTALIEQSRILHEHEGCHAPLILEGWPVPRRDSSLKPDDEE